MPQKIIKTPSDKAQVLKPILKPILTPLKIYQKNINTKHWQEDPSQYLAVLELDRIF